MTNIRREVEQTSKRQSGEFLFSRPELIVTAVAYVFFILVAKVSFTRAGWSAGDAQDYHIPVINYFIKYGFNKEYPQIVAMLPGMHVFFALIARLFNIQALSWDGSAAFLIQSLWGIGFLLATLALYVYAREKTDSSWPLLLPLICSSIPFYSWLWPTTDLGASTVFITLILLLMMHSTYKIHIAIIYAFLVLVAGFFRQSYAVLGAGYGLYYLMNDRASWSRRPIYALICSSLPMIAGAVVILTAYSLWGGLTPPNEHWHGSATNLNISTVVHVIAYTGLMGWPFLFLITPSLREKRIFLVIIISVSVILSILVAMTVSLSYNKNLGHDGSLFWSIVGPDPIPKWRYFIMIVILGFGFYIWLSIAAICYLRKEVPPEIVIGGIYFASLITQNQAWMRYVEEGLFVCLAAFFGYPRVASRLAKFSYMAWFGLYILVIPIKGYSGGMLGVWNHL